MHSSFIKTQLKVPGARLVAVPDAGYWWDTLNYAGTAHPWLDLINMSIPASLWNATLRGGAARCLAAPPDGEPAKCYTQPYAYAYLDVRSQEALSRPSRVLRHLQLWRPHPSRSAGAYICRAVAHRHCGTQHVLSDALSPLGGLWQWHVHTCRGRGHSIVRRVVASQHSGGSSSAWDPRWALPDDVQSTRGIVVGV